jgi:hypothetical protein
MLSNGIQLPQVDTVCITHADTDTMGNLNLFPCAEVNEISMIKFRFNFLTDPFRECCLEGEFICTPISTTFCKLESKNWV